MALKHDAQGFLVGDPIDLSKAVANWAAIRDDVRAIRRAVLGIEGALAHATPERAASAPAMPGRNARMEEADPAIKAFSEVAQPVAPAALRRESETVRPPQNPQAEPSRAALAFPSAPAERRDAQIPALLRAPVVPQTGGAGRARGARHCRGAAGCRADGYRRIAQAPGGRVGAGRGGPGHARARHRAHRDRWIERMTPAAIYQ